MSYREERRADQVAERAQDREDRRLELEARLAADAQRAEQRRLDDAAKEEKERLRAEAQRRQQAADRRARQQEAHRRRAARRARLAKVTRWLNANPVTVFVGFVMASSVIPAVISQVGALGDAHVNVFLAALLASMLEGGAWALTFMGKAAEDAGRPAGKYRVATWCTAVLAATVQYWHWSAKLPGDGWVAVVFAASSLFAIYLWDMKTHGSHGRTRAERREDRARRRHAAEQRRHHRKVAKEADRLRAAMPFGAITESDAFTAAWRIEYGTDPGMTPETYSRLTAAQVELEQAFRIAAEERPVTMRAGLLEGVLNPLRPVPQLLGEALPALGPSVPVARLDKIAEGRTAQAGIGSYASERATVRGPQRAAAQGAKTRTERVQKAPQAAEERPLERLMPKARIVAAELVAEGMQISATSLAKRLQIRRQDAIRLRDMVVAERKADATLHLVPEREAAS